MGLMGEEAFNVGLTKVLCRVEPTSPHPTAVDYRGEALFCHFTGRSICVDGHCVVGLSTTLATGDEAGHVHFREGKPSLEPVTLASEGAAILVVGVLARPSRNLQCHSAGFSTNFRVLAAVVFSSSRDLWCAGWRGRELILGPPNVPTHTSEP